MLARSLLGLGLHRPIVVALPRGGVPVAFEVAESLKAPLDVLLVRKLGVPSQPEFAFGAIGEDGVRKVNADVVRRLGLSPAQVEAVESKENLELSRRARLYRGDRRSIEMKDRDVVIVDDGVATGSTMHVAIEVARRSGAHRVVVAVPVAPDDVVDALARLADQVVCVLAPQRFQAVGEWYDDFDQTSDEEVASLLERASSRGFDRRDEPPPASHVVGPGG